MTNDIAAYDFVRANAEYRTDVRRRFVRDALAAAPDVARVNDYDERQAIYSACHCAMMDIIDQLFPNEENDFCPTVCTSDVAWEVMYALNFHEDDAQGIEARSGETERLDPKDESPVGTADAPKGGRHDQ